MNSPLVIFTPETSIYKSVGIHIPRSTLTERERAHFGCCSARFRRARPALSLPARVRAPALSKFRFPCVLLLSLSLSTHRGPRGRRRVRWGSRAGSPSRASAHVYNVRRRAASNALYTAESNVSVSDVCMYVDRP